MNGNGVVDGPETDPRNPADDPACSMTARAEIGDGPGRFLHVGKSDDDVTLTWGPDPVDPCMLYRIYVADDFDHASGAAAFADPNAANPNTTHPNMAPPATAECNLCFARSRQGFVEDFAASSETPFGSSGQVAKRSV